MNDPRNPTVGRQLMMRIQNRAPMLDQITLFTECATDPPFGVV